MGDHLIVLHSAVRACAGYSRHEAPSILMDGASLARDTEHARAACEDYFYNRLGLKPGDVLGEPEDIAEGLELMPDAMYRALEDVVELVVDGDYAELRALSGDRLGIEDLRRRVEDDCPEALELPPRELYQVEAITKSDDGGNPGWAYFLDLWTETGPARLHIVGEIEEEPGERYTVTLDDILP